MTDETRQPKKKRRIWLLIGGAFVALLIAGYFAKQTLQSKAWLWGSQIRSYEKADAKKPPKPGGILFIGSSSIRYWKTLTQDMAPLPVLNRGFGGAHVPHVTHYADRILFPYKPRLIVLYAGENDLAADKKPAKVMADLDALLKRIHEKLPKAHVFYISVKPSVLRQSHWPVMAAFNKQIAKKLKGLSWVTYVDIAKAMLTAKGKAEPSIFIWDRLHMNAKGYRRWTKIIKPILQQAWAKATSQPTTRRPTKR